MASRKSKDLREGCPEGIKGRHLSSTCYGPTTGCIRILGTGAQRERVQASDSGHTHTVGGRARIQAVRREPVLLATQKFHVLFISQPPAPS